jgi:hypothetical protein
MNVHTLAVHMHFEPFRAVRVTKSRIVPKKKVPIIVNSFKTEFRILFFHSRNVFVFSWKVYFAFKGDFLSGNLALSQQLSIQFSGKENYQTHFKNFFFLCSGRRHLNGTKIIFNFSRVHSWVEEKYI